MQIKKLRHKPAYSDDTHQNQMNNEYKFSRKPVCQALIKIVSHQYIKAQILIFSLKKAILRAEGVI